MEDITAPEIVEIAIREDGKVVWINTEKGCVFRACRIKKLEIDDRREKMKAETRKYTKCVHCGRKKRKAFDNPYCSRCEHRLIPIKGKAGHGYGVK